MARWGVEEKGGRALEVATRLGGARDGMGDRRCGVASTDLDLAHAGCGAHSRERREVGR
jgi:hypothetical protein